MVHGQGSNPFFEMGYRTDGNDPAGIGMNVNVVEGLRGLPELWRYFHHHVVLVERGVYSRDPGLPEGAVESRIHQLGCDS